MIQETEGKFEKTYVVLASIPELFDHFQEYAEDSALDEAKVAHETLKERWQQTGQAIALRQRQIIVSGN